MSKTFGFSQTLVRDEKQKNNRPIFNKHLVLMFVLKVNLNQHITNVVIYFGIFKKSFVIGLPLSVIGTGRSPS